MEDVLLGLCIIFSTLTIWYTIMILPDIIEWWRENYHRNTFIGKTLRIIDNTAFNIFRVIFWIVKILWFIFEIALTLSMIVGLVAAIVITIYEQIAEPSIKFIVLSVCAALFVIYMLCYYVYDKLYGRAKENVQRMHSLIRNIKGQYRRLFAAMQQVNHTGHIEYAQLILAGAEAIIKDSKVLCDSLSDKSIKKYIAEDERIMIFKSIKKETEHLEELCSEIKNKYHGKSRLILPKAQINIHTETDIIFLMIKIPTSKKKTNYRDYPAKIRRTKTTEIHTNEFGEIIFESKAKVIYTVLDFYFYNNNERKPIKDDIQNTFDEIGQKSFITSNKDGKIALYEVVLTNKDATQSYKQCQMIDTVRKVAEDENLLKVTKKSLKGLKLSYNKE